MVDLFVSSSGKGDRKKAVIIPEPVNNGGWGDFARKILYFLGKQTTNRFIAPTPQNRSYFNVANIPQWPKIAKSSTMATNNPIKARSDDRNHHFLSRCLVGTFNDLFNYRPNHKVIQKWFLNRWKICAGLGATPLAHNQFLFELPSRQRAERVHAGDWLWNGRRLSLEWWSPVTGTDLGRRRSNQNWVKAFAIPIHAWSLDTFRTIGDLCGGFVGIDEDTKHRNHFIWARICINNCRAKIPDKIKLDVDESRFKISILMDVADSPKPFPV